PQAPDTPLKLEAILEGSLQAMTPSEQRAPAEGTPDLLQAVALWLQVCRDPVDQAQGLVWRGRVYGIRSQHALAVADFRAALELAPDLFDARLQLAEAIALEAPREAAAHLQQLHQRDPSNNQVRFYLASLRRGLGQFEEAGKLLDLM